MSEDESGGTIAPRLQDFLRAVDVGEEHIQRLDALEKPGLQPLPLGAAEHARHDIEGDQPLGRILVAIDGESNADSPEQKFRLRPAGSKMFRWCFLQPASDFFIDGACLAIGKCHFVEGRPHDPQPASQIVFLPNAY